MAEGPGGGPVVGALEFTRINTKLTILPKDRGVDERARHRREGFLKIKPQLAVGQAKADHQPQAK